MFALYYTEYGDPSVLQAGDVPEPHAKGGQVRIAVRTAGVNPIDWQIRSGAFADTMPQTFPIVPGFEAAGVVDEVGADVVGFAIGDEVFGLGARTDAEFAVLDHFAHKPSGWSWQQAAAVSVGAEAALRALRLLGLTAGQTLLIDNASGSVGSAAAQFARAEGVHVIGTGSASSHERLKALGVVPVAYGPGLPDRVSAVTSAKIDGVIDAAGKGSLTELVEIVSPERIVTLADMGGAELGVTLSTKSDAFDALDVAAALADQGSFSVAIDHGYHFNDAAAAHARGEEGHTAGKIVFGE